MWFPAVVLGLVSAMLVAAGSAHATVIVGLAGKGNTLNVTDVSGATDDLRLNIDRSTSPQSYVIESTQPISRSGTFCTAPTTSGGKSRTRCPTSTPTSILATLAGGNDRWFTVFGVGASDSVTVNGGSGDDQITGTRPGPETFNGNDGNDDIHGRGGLADTLTGGAGDDLLNDEDGSGASSDTLDGGSGEDRLFFREGNDTVRGADGDDEITEIAHLEVATSKPFDDTIFGGSGTDRLIFLRDRGVSIQDKGSAANVFTDGVFEENVEDVEGFEGGRGPDVINGASSSANSDGTYDGGEGPDVLVGRDAADRIVGGNGRDTLQGRDGNDQLDAKEGEPVAVPDEVIDCGPGTDSATIDLLDPNTEGCEKVDRSAIGEGPHVRIGSVRLRGRTAAVKLKCPRKLGHKCKGKLRVAARKRRLRRSKGKRYSIKAGRKRTVRVRLGSRDARRIKKRAFVESREKGDVAGTKSTLARKRIKRA
jgi:Ca2+-binding RTX toxin-like protein